MGKIYVNSGSKARTGMVKAGIIIDANARPAWFLDYVQVLQKTSNMIETISQLG